MSRIVGTFFIGNQKVTIYEDSTYEFPSFAPRGMAPATFHFLDNGELHFAHRSLESKAITSKHYLDHRSGGVVVDDEDTEFYKKLKQLWDEHLIENILLTGENDVVDN